MKNEKEKKDEKKEAKSETAKKDAEKETKKAGKLPTISKNTLLWAAAFVVLAVAAFFAIQSLGKTKSYVLDGMRVEYDSSMTADEGLRAILSQSPQIVRLDTYNSSDSRNSMVAIIAAEVIRNIAYANRTVYGYAAVYNTNNTATETPTMINCDANNSNCGTPTVIVRYGSCNCLKILPSQGQIIVEGDSSFATTHATKVGQIIGMVEAEIANSTAK
ncbi:MAG: hypothetical protein WCX64_03215 [Candidatus Micrarchaeia archaeon]